MYFLISLTLEFLLNLRFQFQLWIRWLNNTSKIIETYMMKMRDDSHLGMYPIYLSSQNHICFPSPTQRSVGDINKRVHLRDGFPRVSKWSVACHSVLRVSYVSKGSLFFIPQYIIFKSYINFFHQQIRWSRLISWLLLSGDSASLFGHIKKL